MPRFTLYRHPDCVRCARIARVHRLFDWLGRVGYSEQPPASGPLRLGEIAVVYPNGTELKGIAAVRTVFRNIPAYWPLLPLLYIPPIARRIDQETRGCADGACGVAPSAAAAIASPTASPTAD